MLIIQIRGRLTSVNTARAGNQILAKLMCYSDAEGDVFSKCVSYRKETISRIVLSCRTENSPQTTESLKGKSHSLSVVLRRLEKVFCLPQTKILLRK